MQPNQGLADWASSTVAGNDLTTWGVAIAAWLATAIGVLLIRNLARRSVARWAQRTPSSLDDALADLIERTRAFFAMAIGALAALAVLDLPGPTEQVARQIIVAVGLVQAGLWGAGLVRHAVARLTSDGDPRVGNATGILRVLGVATVWAVVVLLLLANVGVDVTAGIAGLGIGGVAVALAVQNILSDLFASLSIVIDRPFGVGDFVTIGDLSGTVERIGIKTTRIRAVTGEQLVFGNGDLLSSRIRNFRDLKERRVVVTFGVAYATRHDVLGSIPQIVKEIVQAEPKTRFDHANLIRFGESSIDFELVWFFLGSDGNEHLEVQQRVMLGVLRRFGELAIEMPFPNRTVWVQPAPAA